jgi:NADH:ubiquinone oxidoreductase subunit 5 (subunit L)/multisubunit Na+/H+ antiporter MnhA subunit
MEEENENILKSMYIYVSIIPFTSAFIVGILGRFSGHKGCTFISIISITLNLILSLSIFYEVVIAQSLVIVRIYNRFLSDTTKIEFNLLFDGLVGSMNLIVCIISFPVHLYSISYMSHDPYLSRFLSFLSLFTFFMLVLVTADNFIQLFIG